MVGNNANLSRIIIYSSVLIFLIKIHYEKIFDSKDYKDFFIFLLSKLKMKENLYLFISDIIENHLHKVILFSASTAVISMFRFRLASLITVIIYSALLIPYFFIKKDIFKFDFYHISQEFLLLIGSIVSIPVLELTLSYNKKDVGNQKEKLKIA